MASTFDIFKVRAGGSLRITTVSGFREAKVQMARFALISLGRIFHSVTGKARRGQAIRRMGRRHLRDAR